MYINFNLLSEKSLGLRDLMLLQMCKQQKFENVESSIEKLVQGKEEVLHKIAEKGLIEFIKGNPKDSLFSRARATSKAVELLSDIETPAVIEEDLILYEWVKKVYERRNKRVGNPKNCKKYIALFRTHSGISGNKLALLIQTFLKDVDQMEYSHVAEYVFFKKESVYQTRFDIEGSRLYQYYIDKKEYFDKTFEKL